MKLNKRKCRKFADPGFKFHANNGLLCAKQISYIIRTRIKIIDHHKILILYVYPRKQVVKGNCQPCYTVFQSKDDYITLARKEDGSTTWRKCAFNNLDSSYRFSDCCAFYSAHDESCVSCYFKADADSGFKPLIKAQDSILERRRRERQLTREKAVIDRMAEIPALPRDLRSWIHKIMPAYLFYNYDRKAKDTEGVCSACGKKVILSNVKQGHKGTCPHCKRELIMKPRSRRGCCMTDRDTCQVIQHVGNGELVIRIFKVYYTYTGDRPKIDIYENTRQFLSLDADGKICREGYYYSYNSGILTRWKKGERPPLFSRWQYYFESDTCAYLFCKNLSDTLKGTVWQYCPIADFYNHFHERVQALPFLTAHLRHPRLEHLIKVGFYNIVADIVYNHNSDGLDESQNRTHRILGVAAEDVAFLQEMDVNMDTLRKFQKYAGIKD